jgi:hypothetical protein
MVVVAPIYPLPVPARRIFMGLKAKGVALLCALPVFIIGCVESTISAGETRVTGSGDVVMSERPVSGVTGVHLATFGDLMLEIGKEESFVIVAEDNLIEFIETEVEDGVLRIETRRGFNLKPRKQVKFLLTVKHLDTIAISSSGDVTGPHLRSKTFHVSSSSSGDLVLKGLDAESAAINLSSSGDVDIGRIEAGDLDVNISSSGDLSIEEGRVGFQGVRLSSSGDYLAGHVESEDAKVSISSSGDAYIHVEGTLRAALSSSGSLYYSGNPSVTVSASSSGRARRVQD